MKGWGNREPGLRVPAGNTPKCGHGMTRQGDRPPNLSQVASGSTAISEFTQRPACLLTQKS